MKRAIPAFLNSVKLVKWKILKDINFRNVLQATKAWEIFKRKTF